MFKDKDVDNIPPRVENRSNNSIKENKATNSSSAVVNADSVVTVEVSKGNLENTNPNKLFQDYSIYFDYDEYTVKEKFFPIIK